MGDKLVSADKEEETSPPTSNGFGLKKWRRIRRDLVKDSSVNMENSRILNKVLSGAVDPHAKHIHFPRPGSVGSVNSVVGFKIDRSSHGGNGLAFAAGMNSEVRTMVNSCGKQREKYLSGKSVISGGQQRKGSVEKIKKLRGERIKIEKENYHSSMESADSRSSNFVFVQGASFSFNSRKQGGRRMMDYKEEKSDHDADKGDEDEESQSQRDSVEDSQIKNNGSPDNLKAAFDSFHSLQEVFKKEIQKFQEIGKETLSAIDEEGESSSCIHAGHERASESTSSRRSGSTSLDSDILNLVNKIKLLETKLKASKYIAEVKDSQVRQLESSRSVSELRNGRTEMGTEEEIFLVTMEAEIEHIVYSSSVANADRQIKLFGEENISSEKLAKNLAKLKTKAESLKNQLQDLDNHHAEIQEVKSLKKRVYKTTSCLLLQLGLVFMFFSFLKFMSESENVVPT